MVSGKRIFITGGAGFIGSSLIKRIIDQNKVTIYDNFHRNALKYSDLMNHPNLTIKEGDILDREKVRQSIEASNIVLHLASIAGVDTVLSMPVKTMEVALIGTYNVLKAAKELTHLERFIDFSTSEVFGSFAFNVHENDPTTVGSVGEARWTYAVSKLATEHLALNYYKEYAFPTVSIRPFNIFGPMQVGIGAIKTFIKRALTGESLYIHNEGTQIRSWCYIDDIVDGILLCMSKKEAVGQAFNIGNPRNTLTIYNRAKTINRLCGSKSKIILSNKKIVDTELRMPSTEKAKRLLGFKPKVDLEEGLIKTIEWYRKNDHDQARQT